MSPGTPIVGINLGNTPVTDAWLDRLKGLATLRSLDLSGTNVTDAGIERLKGLGLTNLEKLLLYSMGVTDAGLAHLKGFRKLRNLNIAGRNPVVFDQRVGGSNPLAPT